MKTEHKQFKEMILNSCDIKENPNCEECLFSVVCDVKEICEKLYKAGYRKASDVIDEFVKKITCRLSYDRDSELYGKTKIVLMLNKIVAEMRHEVEK